MDEVEELQNMENVCRLCLSADEPKSSVFGVQDSPVSLAAKIQACLSIQISSTDRLTTLICAECVKSVNQWHNYKESCLRSQEKLHEWLENHLQSNPTVVTIKDEPVDLDFYEDNIEVISESTDDSEPHDTELAPSVNEIVHNDHIQELTDDEFEDLPRDKTPESVQPTSGKDSVKDIPHIDKQLCDIPIKTEPQDDYDTDCTIEIESVTGSELLLNPIAGKDDVIMEADSTQKSNATASSNKKKVRRGPHTHFRGTRVYKQKCAHCQINLHSKYSYSKHMQRFHSQEQSVNVMDTSQSQDEEELVEDLEDELVNMEEDAPLTQVQQNIISQLKTFSCYSCQQTFNDRRSTLSHIRQHMPDLRPYTCIACLTEFPDRSMYKLHCGASFECAMKIALVVPKQGHEKYFTCNMCLRSMHSRKELLSHLSRHSDKQYEELISPTRSPPKLKPMAPLPSPKNDVPPKPATPSTVIPGPYKNGDPAHNHICDLCGMIYRYRPNMLKHRELCMRLLPEVRTSYKCVHCGMTFLVFKKFHSHITVDHKKKEFACSECNTKFKSPSDYLTHHESHRSSRSEKKVYDGPMDASKPPQSTSAPVKDWDTFEAEMNSNKVKNSNQYSCALCSLEFATRAELTEHRNLHLKVKIYSCVICRSMFSSAGALEIHMKDHGIEDPNERNANSSCVEYGRLEEEAQDVKSVNTSTVSDPGNRKNECVDCGKIFSNYANLRRHVRNIHKDGKTHFTCSECSRTFKSKDMCARHMQIEHKSAKTMHQCPQCPKSFVFRANLNLHFLTAHGEKSHGGQKCDICGKVFLEEASLKIHKGWHNRANSRLSLRFMVNNEQKDVKHPVTPLANSSTNEQSFNTAPKQPARARKSFPNPPPTKPQSNYQCQVCDDKFNDVTELRKHLWDVHCARNKPEKSFSGDELQCELCTNVFPDQETLSIHMQWHKAHPILSDIRKPNFPCDVCGKLYSSKKVLWRHKKLHKATTVASIKFQSLARKPMASQYLCTICRKVFSSNQSLQRHKYSFHNDAQNQKPHQPIGSNPRRASLEETKPKRVKIEVEDNPQRVPFAVNVPAVRKKPVMCHLCKKFFPNMSVLYKHKQVMHKTRPNATKSSQSTKTTANECVPMPGLDGKISCNVCFKQFSGLPNLRQHFSLKHKNNLKYACHIEGCKLVFPSPSTLKSHELSHTSMIFSCKLCDRHVFSRPAMTKHMLTVHNTVYEAENNKNFHRETDLTSYVVKGAVGATCPRCKIKYPNNRAMKIHYFKFHETAD